MERSGVARRRETSTELGGKKASSEADARNCGNHLKIYTNTQPYCCTPETNAINYLNLKIYVVHHCT